MNLRSFAIIIDPVRLRAIKVSLLFACSSEGVFVFVLLDLTLWVLSTWKKVIDRDTRWRALSSGIVAALLLFLVPLLLFLLSCKILGTRPIELR